MNKRQYYNNGTAEIVCQPDDIRLASGYWQRGKISRPRHPNMGGKYEYHINKQFTVEYITAVCTRLKIKHDYSNITYVNVATPITLVCNLHGPFDVLFTKIKNNNEHYEHCPICGALKGQKVRLTLDQYIVVSNIVHNNKYDYSLVYDLSSTHITPICKKHGTFSIRKSAHISPTQQYGCQKCAKGGISKGEEYIINFLTDLNIRYVREKTFPDLRGFHGHQLRYDFYLPDHNILIEYDGAHHYRSVKYGSVFTNFNKTINSDLIKNFYADGRGITLIRIGMDCFKSTRDILLPYFTKVCATIEPIITVGSVDVYRKPMYNCSLDDIKYLIMKR